MTLTIGTGPFGSSPSGRLNFDPPDHVVYVEGFPRRVRAVQAGRVVIDSDRVLLVHQSGKLPHYAFPAGEVDVAAEAEPHADGYVTVPWGDVDAWFEEDERVEVHPRDPYHRIDTFSTSRRITVSIDGVVVAQSTRARALYETALPVRWYLRPADVNRDLLEESDTVTECAYKGTAAHWHARINGELRRDVGWSYHHVRREGEPVKDLIAFYNERVDIDVDGSPQERPRTQWSRD